MKIRNGFVSNSSSSSFVIYGTMETMTDELAEKLDELGINYWNPHDYGDDYIGIEFSDMELDETKRQFQDRVTKKLEEAGLTGPFAWYEESWYDS